MKDDAIITEVREVRHRISETHGHDLDRLGKHYRALERRLAKTGKYRFVTDFYSVSEKPAKSRK